MVNKVSKTKKSKLSIDPLKFNLKKTRLKKVMVETLIPFDKGKGKVDLQYKAGQLLDSESNSLVVFLLISGKAFTDKDNSEANAFNFDAELEGIFTSSVTLDESMLEESLATQLSKQLLPLLVDMIKTLLLKSGYGSVSLPLSFDES